MPPLKIAGRQYICATEVKTALYIRPELADHIILKRTPFVEVSKRRSPAENRARRSHPPSTHPCLELRIENPPPAQVGLVLARYDGGGSAARKAFGLSPRVNAQPGRALAVQIDAVDASEETRRLPRLLGERLFELRTSFRGDEGDACFAGGKLFAERRGIGVQRCGPGQEIETWLREARETGGRVSASFQGINRASRPFADPDRVEGQAERRGSRRHRTGRR